MTTPLYDNREGYTMEALRLSYRVRQFAESILRDYPDVNALELVGLITSAVTEAHCSVSLERRLSEPRSEDSPPSS